MKMVKSKTGARRLNREATDRLRNPIQLAFFLQDWEDPYNVGSMFRVADACGATEMFLSARTPFPPHPQISVTSLGNHRRVQFEYFKRNAEALDHIAAAGYNLIAVELADEGMSFNQFQYPEKTCLVLGNEVNGVYTDTLARCSGAVFIPMAGKGRSMNVHVAAAVVGFTALFGPIPFAEQ